MRQGQPYTFTGVKNIHDDDGLDVWPDTTTLYVKLWKGRVEAAQETGTPAGAGIIRILMARTSCSN